MSQIQISSPIEEVFVQGEYYYEHTSDVDAASFIRAYELGYCEPRYAMPAIPVKVEWHSEDEDGPFNSAVLFLEKTGEICPCCGNEWYLTAVVDFNFDRCCDFFLPLGQYVNKREIDEGLAAAREFDDAICSIH